MKKIFFLGCAFIVISALLIISSATATTYFSKNGKLIDGKDYERNVSAQKPVISQIAQEGYAEVVIGFEDPVMLRKKRIEQWKQWRKSKGRRMN